MKSTGDSHAAQGGVSRWSVDQLAQIAHHQVGAVAPQHVCVFDALVWIDGVPVAAVLAADRLGRPLPSWPHCRRLEAGELFLLSSTNPVSFDSRYFGPVRAAAVIGVAHPLWLEKRP